jgi:hypothetical protein
VIDPRYPERATFWQFNARTGDRIFINGDFLPSVVNVLSRYRRKHVFVIHNSDLPFDEARLNSLLPYALHIYAINTTVKHPQLTTIPIGFPDAGVTFLSTFVRPDVPRDIELYMNFSLGTNVQKRVDCYNALKDDPRVVIRSNRSRKEYHEDLCRSKYVLCPEGAGIDTHRVYEAILCGAIPVVLRNPLAEFYSKYPVKIVESWTYA